MTRILPALAEAYHSNDVRPYSLYLRKTAEKGIYSGQLGILREDAESLADVLTQSAQVCICGMREPARLEIMQTDFVDLHNEIEARRGGRLCLHFVTPAVYKLHSMPCCFPDLPRLFHSVLKKMSMYEGIVIDEETFRQYLSGMRITDWTLQKTDFLITGRMQQEMTGVLECVLPREETAQRTLKAFFPYYSSLCLYFMISASFFMWLFSCSVADCAYSSAYCSAFAGVLVSPLSVNAVQVRLTVPKPSAR